MSCLLVKVVSFLIWRESLTPFEDDSV